MVSSNGAKILNLFKHRPASVTVLTYEVTRTDKLKFHLTYTELYLGTLNLTYTLT